MTDALMIKGYKRDEEHEPKVPLLPAGLPLKPCMRLQIIEANSVYLSA